MVGLGDSGGTEDADRSEVDRLESERTERFDGDLLECVEERIGLSVKGSGLLVGGQMCGHQPLGGRGEATLGSTRQRRLWERFKGRVATLPEPSPPLRPPAPPTLRSRTSDASYVGAIVGGKSNSVS